MTVKEQQEWKIPPCISNWKNAKVFVFLFNFYILHKYLIFFLGQQLVISIVCFLYLSSYIMCTNSFQGYTIPLDKRLAADGRGLQTVHINENFAKLAEALYIADRKVIHNAYVVQIFFFIGNTFPLKFIFI